MLIAGLVVAAIGFVFLLDLGRAAEKFAAMARPLPAWMTWPWSTSPVYYRFMGALFIAMGALFLGAALER